jgi:hypothetical protein
MLKDGTFNNCLRVSHALTSVITDTSSCSTLAKWFAKLNVSKQILTIGVLPTQDDPATRRWLQQLLHNVTGGGGMGGAPQPGLDHMMGI